MTTEEIYRNISNNIKNSINEPWDKAILIINVSQNFSSYSGVYFSNGQQKTIKVSRFDMEIDNDLIEMHTITTSGGNSIENWNMAKFTLTNNAHFDIEFLWDEKLQD